MKGSSYNNQDTANVVIDMGVNIGPDDGTMMMQYVLNNSFGKSIAVDGVAGPVTLNTVNSVNQNKFFNEFLAMRKLYYDYRANIKGRNTSHDALFKKMKAVSDSGQQVNYKGWMKRIASFGTKTVAVVSTGMLFFFGLS
jgi:lysozyme family protein